MIRSAQPVRIGVIGCGNVLTAYRAPLEKLQARGLAEVTLACGRAAQRESASAELGAVSFTTSTEEVFASPEIDAVMLLTSMPEHGRLARAALESGKHVFVEKPLATRLDEGKELAALAQRSPGCLVCAPFVILSPTFQTIS